MSSSSGLFTKETFNSINLLNIDDNADFVTPKEQINDLRKYMGFNISELAKIIKVKRPTIYEWLEGKSPNPRNQTRLDLIYSFCKRWKEMGAGRLGRYMYRNVTQDNKCLMDLLEEKIINEGQINKVLDVIAASLFESKKGRAAREKILKSEGFESISKGEQRSRLMKLTRKIS
jgi:DNA-binding XRE family transcriptional regulator